MLKKPSLIIIGSGIVGLAIAREAYIQDLFEKIIVIEKEKEAGFHATSRNSGVIHAGFYYSPESKKAKFCAEGNLLFRHYIINNSLLHKPSGKVVVSRNNEQDKIIEILGKRALLNNCDVSILDDKSLSNYEPKAKTNKLFLWSPNTWTASPRQVLKCILEELKEYGIEIITGKKLIANEHKSIVLSDFQRVKYDVLVNASGGHALSISKLFGINTPYRMLPFKGLYLRSNKPNKDFKTHIYPVPDLNQPFLGIHTTLTVDNHLKLGPTALPVFSPENYTIFERLDLKMTPEIIGLQSLFFLKNTFKFRDLAVKEFRYLFKENIVKSAQLLTNYNLESKEFHWQTPGIRAQLFNSKINRLETDFIIETTKSTVHILNSISPAWTCSFKTAQFIVGHIREKLL